MSHVWINASDGDLLRADQIRQINVVEGLRVVLIGGNQFLIADIESRDAAAAAARELTAAITEAEAWSHAAEISVVRGGHGWKVRLKAMRDTGQPEKHAA